MTAFWEQKTLAEFSAAEWERVCDGCGKCCLHKLQDEDTDELYFTDIACRLLNSNTCRCTDYPDRLAKQSECIVISVDKPEVFEWLPSTCAYRLLWQGMPLPHWHPLLTGSHTLMHQLGMSVRGRVFSESQVQPDALEDHIVHWVDSEEVPYDGPN